MKLSQAIINYVDVAVRSALQDQLLPDEMKALVKAEQDLEKACSAAERTDIPHTLLDMIPEE